MSDTATGPRPSPGKDCVLVPHPDFSGSTITSIEVTALRTLDGQLQLVYRVAGITDEVLWPDPLETAGLADNLWQHSCFEAFVARFDDSAYYELNFATSGAYAVYRFDDYRVGMHNAKDALTVRSWETPVATFKAQTYLPDMTNATDWKLNIAAVIEEIDGTKSYWALAHAPGPPDFHNRDCFIATLPAPDGS